MRKRRACQQAAVTVNKAFSLLPDFILIVVIWKAAGRWSLSGEQEKTVCSADKDWSVSEFGWTVGAFVPAAMWLRVWGSVDLRRITAGNPAWLFGETFRMRLINSDALCAGRESDYGGWGELYESLMSRLSIQLPLRTADLLMYSGHNVWNPKIKNN